MSTTVSSNAPDPMIGRRFGSFVVQRKLGEGGMGAVYELVHPTIGKRQALKVLHAEYAKKASIVDRFFAEAKAVVTIGHPNIVDITDFATLDDGTAYIVMEFLEGQSLAGYVKQRGAMQPAEMAQVVLPICDALGAAHALGIVHRDLKPENVHLVPRPDNPRYVKVLDFGIAKLATGDGASGPMTKTGQVMGTPTYMSPEQAMGRTREIDHRTDIYALGVMIYQLLTGELPFQADSFGDLMLMHLSQPPPPLAMRRPDLPPAWDAIIQRALAKSRDDRWGSMREVADAIHRALGGQMITAPPQMVPTVAMPIAAHGTAPPVPYSQPGTGPGTGPGVAAFAQGTVPATHQSWPPPGQPTPAPGSVPPAAATAPGAAKKSKALPVALLLIAIATAVAVVVIVTGGKKSSGGALAGGTIDAGVVTGGNPPTAPTNDGGAAQVAMAPPADAAQVAAATPPDASAGPAAPSIDAGAAPELPTGSGTGTGTGASSGSSGPISKDDHHHHRPPPPPPGGHGKPGDPASGSGAGTGSGSAAATTATTQIRVTAVPWGNVSVDGKGYGQTPVLVTVPVGKPVHVKVENPETGVSKSETVVGDAGTVKPVRFDVSGDN